MSDALVSRRSPALRHASRMFDWTLDGCNAVGTLLIIALGLLINADVLGRALFNHPLAGVPELAGLAIVAIVFLQIPYCLRGLHLTRSDAFLQKLSGRRPRVAALFDAMFHAGGAAVFLVIAYVSWTFTLRAWLGGEYEGAAGVFTIPVWPVKLIVAVGSTLMAAQYLRTLAQRLVSAATGNYPAADVLANGGDL